MSQQILAPKLVGYIIVKLKTFPYSSQFSLLGTVSPCCSAKTAFSKFPIISHTAKPLNSLLSHTLILARHLRHCITKIRVLAHGGCAGFL